MTGAAGVRWRDQSAEVWRRENMQAPVLMQRPGRAFHQNQIRSVMDVTGLDKVTGQDIFFMSAVGHVSTMTACTSFHKYSNLLTFFRCFILLIQSCCSHAQVFEKTLMHEFPFSEAIILSHTEWNLLSSGTNNLFWWRVCYKTIKLQTNKQTDPFPNFWRKLCRTKFIMLAN